jgi:N,N'-diacetyllegionaminate synthase
LNKKLPLLIAEIGGNHEGNFDYALQLVDLALTTPVDYVKFQIYSGDALVSSVEDPDRNAHFKKFELSIAQHEEIIQKILQSGKKYLASVWDIESIDWIDSYVDAYKIGSGDVTAFPLLKRIANTSKPILLSTGLSTMEEVQQAVDYIRNCNSFYHNSRALCVLQCTSMYPIKNSDAHLNVLHSYKKQFGTQVGYSDHTTGMKALELAAVMGAEVLEFHFTDTREGKIFRDHTVSLTPEEVHTLVDTLNSNLAFLGDAMKMPLPIEIDNGHVQSFRRAIYPSRDIEEGEIFGAHNLTVLRPNKGIDARFFEELVGKKALKPFKKHEALQWEHIQ